MTPPISKYSTQHHLDVSLKIYKVEFRRQTRERTEKLQNQEISNLPNHQTGKRGRLIAAQRHKVSSVVLLISTTYCVFSFISTFSPLPFLPLLLLTSVIDGSSAAQRFLRPPLSRVDA